MTNEEAIVLIGSIQFDLTDGYYQREDYTEALCVFERLNQENTKLKADNERIYSDINAKIIARRWKITSDCTPIEYICMDWANRMNDWCVEIVEQSLKNNL